jgi:putative glutamine amidotransferase
VPTPLVAVVGRRYAAGRAGRNPSVSLGRTYLDALARAGARAVVVPPQLRPGPDALDGFAGLVLPGGGDVEPARYGAEPDPRTGGVDPDLDAAELALLDVALARGLPVLAICRGHQLLNVAFGGTLRQHISDDPALVPHGVIPSPGEVLPQGPLHPVDVEPGSRLAEALGGELRPWCASTHHQAVDVVGTGLRVVGRSPDGLVEAIEPAPDVCGSWVLGVQWHPEDTAGSDPVQQRLFDAFVAAARRSGG